jgi:ABC-type branched-subunit amino acid transport system substrate-binding protein
MAQPQPNRQWLSIRTIATLAAISILAACTPGGRGPRPEAGPAKPVEQRPASEEDRQKVAVLVPTTGPNAALGQSIANAANMALLDSGSQRIRLTIYNTAGGAAVAAQRALADGNKLFLGPLLAPDVRAVQGMGRAANVPIVTFSNDATLAGGGTYVLGFQVGQSIERVVDYARAHGVTRFAALVPAGAYGQRASSAMIDAVEASGGRMTSIATFTRDTRSLTTAVRKLTGADAPAARAQVRPDGTVARVAPQTKGVPFDAVLIADSGKVALAALPILQKSGARSVRLLGTELWNTEPGLARVAAMQGAWFASVPDNYFRQFASRYRSRFGSEPYRLASLGYDSVLLVNRIASKWQPGTPFPQAALRDKDGFAGVDGAFRFGGPGIAVRALEVQQVGAGTFNVVSPAPASFK